MRSFIKFLGFLEIIGGIIYLIIFFVGLTVGFDRDVLILSIALFINGSVFIYIGDLGDKVESVSNVANHADERIELLERRKTADRVDEVEKKIFEIEQKLNIDDFFKKLDKKD